MAVTWNETQEFINFNDNDDFELLQYRENMKSIKNNNDYENGFVRGLTIDEFKKEMSNFKKDIMY